MKTSNKILIALIVFVFGAYATLNAMLYSKIKGGKFVTREQFESSHNNRIKVNTFTKLELVNCGDIFVTNSDSAYLSVEKGNDGKYSYKTEGDKLIITGQLLGSNGRSYFPMRIMTSPLSEIVLKNSHVFLRDVLSPNVNLSADKNSSVYIVGGTIESMKLSADNSASVEFSDEATVKNIDLSLGGTSSFNPNGAKISHIKTTFISDSARVEFSGRVLKALADTTATK